MNMRIEHVAMYVKDLEAVRDFFVTYFNGNSNVGYYNKTTNFRSYFISFDDGARLEIMNKPDVADSKVSFNSMGYVHMAFSVGSKERVDELTSKLKADGFKVVSGPRTTGDGYYESCVVAIEENQIEITIWKIPICREKSRQKNDMKTEYCLPLGSDYLNRQSATFFIFRTY